MILIEIFLRSILDLVIPIGLFFVSFPRLLFSTAANNFSKLILVSVIAVFIITGAILKNKSKLNKIFRVNKQTKTNKIYQLYLPKSRSLPNSSPISSGILIKNVTKIQLPKICSKKDAKIWKTCDPAPCKPHMREINWTYPHTTLTGEKTSDFINRVLKAAWGTNPPSIDLYWRSGCQGIMEMKYLFESIELFWPRFLGSVVIVLDARDEFILKHLLPKNPTHHYIIGFEHVPCLPGRVFNQYSYMNLDRHCTANYVVTIDSDCVFHSPVTPDLIFREGRVILASSNRFQKTMWKGSIDAVLGPGLYQRHYMVTQPVTFALSTFRSFREWFHKTNRICYEDRIATLSPNYYSSFCWMCQLGTYLERGRPPKDDYEKYWFHNLDNSTLQPILRYSIHVTYEKHGSIRCSGENCYEKNTNEVIMQGLCRAFGPSIFRQCTNRTDFRFVDQVTFLYAHSEIQAANKSARMKVLKNYLNLLTNTTKLVTSANMGS